MERRTTTQPVRLERAEGGGKISGHAAVFFDGTRTTEYEIYEDFRERILPGAFDDALSRGDDTRALFNHDASNVLGRSTAGTLKLSLDERGLVYEIEPPDTTVARDVMTLIERGDVSGSSFAFRAQEVTWRTIEEDGRQVDIREIAKVELFDVGPVTYPAYEGSDVGLKSTDGNREAIAAREAWKRDKAAEADEDATNRRRREHDFRMMEINESGCQG